VLFVDGYPIRSAYRDVQGGGTLSEWKECKLGDLCKITRGASPRPIHEWISSSGTPWVKISDATASESRYINSTRECIKEHGEIHSLVVHPGDLILSNSATPGLPRFMKIRACIHDGWLLFRDIEAIEKSFLYYLLINDREKYVQFGNGSIFTNLKTDILKEHRFLLPTLPEQCAIAGVLSSLDDKIDLLHRQNKTLEAIAEVLWRKMFVEEADPGWGKGILRDYIKIIDNRGKTPPFVDVVTEFPIIEVNALTETGIMVDYSVVKKYVTQEVYDGWFRSGHPKKNDILISTVGSIGEISMFLIDKGTIAQNVVALRAMHISPFYLYGYLKYFQDDIKEFDIGSVQPSIKVTQFTNINFVQPDNETLKLFDSKVQTLANKIVSNYVQIQTLTTLRDALLPKLMSGEMRINNQIRRVK
jgi:type I restriction enzyme, S subunit